MAATASGTGATSGPPDQPQRVGGERDRDGRDRAALDHQQQRPAVEESGQRMPAVAQVDVLAAGLREERRRAPRRRTRRRARSRRPRPTRRARGLLLSSVRATMYGLMKMPEPTMPPMTTMVASKGPSARRKVTGRTISRSPGAAGHGRDQCATMDQMSSAISRALHGVGQDPPGRPLRSRRQQRPRLHARRSRRRARRAVAPGTQRQRLRAAR